MLQSEVDDLTTELNKTNDELKKKTADYQKLEAEHAQLEGDHEELNDTHDMYCIASKTQIDELTEELTAEKETTSQQKKEIQS